MLSHSVSFARAFTAPLKVLKDCVTLHMQLQGLAERSSRFAPHSTTAMQHWLLWRHSYALQMGGMHSSSVTKCGLCSGASSCGDKHVFTCRSATVVQAADLSQQGRALPVPEVAASPVVQRLVHVAEGRQVAAHTTDSRCNVS